VVRVADAEDVVHVALWAVKQAKRLRRGEKARLQYALANARNKAITWYRRKEVDRPVLTSFDDAREETANDGAIQPGDRCGAPAEDRRDGAGGLLTAALMPVRGCL
jgi:DNA-directed RNA polymerase specialized sigma24 family protein